MSKSKGNVVFQTDISDKYGIDTARLFLMFVSSPDKQMEWSDQGVEGSFRIINKLIKLSENLKKESTAQEDHKIHSAIEKVTINIENFNYPKAIISILDLIDFCSNGISKKNYEVLLKLISPFCPYVAEELWEKLGNKKLISVSEWPIFDEKKINEQFEKIEQMVEELCKDINNISNLLKIKGNNFSKIYVYALPSEEKEYKDNLTLIKKKTNAEIEIYSVNDPKIFDPEQKAKKAKLGKPALYLK
jgi:leucyl-tRNA synthetase